MLQLLWLCRTYFLASSARETGTWLDGLPLSSFTLCMDVNTICLPVAVSSYRLSLMSPTHLLSLWIWGWWLCHPGIICSWSEVCQYCHSTINDIIAVLCYQLKSVLILSPQVSAILIGMAWYCYHEYLQEWSNDVVGCLLPILISHEIYQCGRGSGSFKLSEEKRETKNSTLGCSPCLNL